MTTNRKFITDFPISLRWTAYRTLPFNSSPKGGSRIQADRFSYKSGFLWKKVCYEVCAKTFSGKVGLSNRVQMVGGRRPLLPGIMDQRDLPLQIRLAHSLVITNRKSTTGFPTEIASRPPPLQRGLSSIAELLFRIFRARQFTTDLCIALLFNWCRTFCFQEWNDQVSLVSMTLWQC